MVSVTVVKDQSKLENRTFFHDDKLPSLPVPNIEETIKTYLDSCKAVLDKDDLKKTTLICDKFLKNEAKILQKKLLERSLKCRNWLEEWWLQKAYLETRTPMPLQNFSGTGTYLETVWPLKDGTQIERAALSAYLHANFWDLLRKELVVPHTFDGKYLSMHQFRFLFSTTRIPQKGKDCLKHFFKTETESKETPSHMIVLCQGYIFKIDAIDVKSGQLTTPPQYYSMFKQIRKICHNRKTPAPGVAALTSLQRDEWADARLHLCSLSSSNQKNIDDIESALLVFAFDDISPRNYSELSCEGIIGDPSLRWYDKSYTSITTRNGALICNCDHSPCDAMVTVALIEFITISLTEMNGTWPGPLEAKVFPNPIELSFDLDIKLLKYITTAKKQSISMRKNIEVVQPVFDKFGKAALKAIHIHPDFMVQLCLQLAYMHIHGKPGPSYETAMTRQFYHGRTETCRTCTPEVVAFCQAMLAHPVPGSKEYDNLLPLLRNALTKFISLMKSCTLNKGCDRHLLGLYLVCVEDGMPIPELYTDKGYTATGGNGNFVLSTSCIGYFKGQGSTVPMLEDGYGFFYRINDEKIVYSVTSYKSSSFSNCQQLSDCFQYYMANILQLTKNDDAFASKL